MTKNDKARVVTWEWVPDWHRKELIRSAVSAALRYGYGSLIDRVDHVSEMQDRLRNYLAMHLPPNAVPVNIHLPDNYTAEDAFSSPVAYDADEWPKADVYFVDLPCPCDFSQKSDKRHHVGLLDVAKKVTEVSDIVFVPNLAEHSFVRVLEGILENPYALAWEKNVQDCKKGLPYVPMDPAIWDRNDVWWAYAHLQEANKRFQGLMKDVWGVDEKQAKRLHLAPYRHLDCCNAPWTGSP